MRWTAAVSCMIAGVAAGRLAAAQPAPTPTPDSAAPTAPAAPAPTVAPTLPAPLAVARRDDPAWRSYHDVFAALMQGDRARARELASALVHDHPDHPAAALVRGAHLELAPGGPPTLAGPGVAGGSAVDRNEPERDAGPEVASRGARAELALFQSLHGVVLGVELCIVLECDSAQAFLGVPLVGGLVGAVAALNLPDVTSGERALLNSGTAWGAVNAGLLLAAHEPDDASTVGLVLIGGQAAGLIAGAALFRVHPTAGQVALANSGGQWTAVVSQLALTASGADLSGSDGATAALVAVDAGLAAGALFASRWPRVSRAQTLVIDAGGIAGTVGGGAIGVVISGDTGARSTAAFAAVGALVGLGAAAYFTRDWGDTGTSAVHAYVAPPERGRGGIAGIGLVW